jgi:hypothetical protein
VLKAPNAGSLFQSKDEPEGLGRNGGGRLLSVFDFFEE